MATSHGTLLPLKTLATASNRNFDSMEWKLSLSVKRGTMSVDHKKRAVLDQPPNVNLVAVAEKAV